ncbi:hypothetical protein T459_04108 [Capsicum annuum]|uniref:J domain-containing protein n=1 Tax=Capsicum annuum TaxID=4072 RepID=A0A2G3A428_CAPAN|nr:hypothetical protein T459_04108 [Capsicum annuum]
MYIPSRSLYIQSLSIFPFQFQIKTSSSTLLLLSTMISTSFHQSPLPIPANIFFSSENSKLSPSCVRFRQSSFSSVAATICSCVASCLSVSSTSFYEVLGIPIGAKIGEIKTAYRRLARVCHPDESYADEFMKVHAAFMKVHAAYCTLSDPGKRADYDGHLFPRRQRSNLYSANTCRNWETDQCW